MAPAARERHRWTVRNGPPPRLSRILRRSSSPFSLWKIAGGPGPDSTCPRHGGSCIVIGSVRRKALRAYWMTGRKRGRHVHRMSRLRRILVALEAAEEPEGVNYPRIALPCPEGRSGWPLLRALDGQCPRHLRAGRRRRDRRGHGGLSPMIERRPSVEPVHPGEILREEVLPALAMSRTALAAALGISPRAFRDVLDEKRPLAAETAVRSANCAATAPASGPICNAPTIWRAPSARWTYPEYRPLRRVRDRAGERRDVPRAIFPRSQERTPYRAACTRSPPPCACAGRRSSPSG